jgi:hypothetical protein
MLDDLSTFWQIRATGTKVPAIPPSRRVRRVLGLRADGWIPATVAACIAVACSRSWWTHPRDRRPRPAPGEPQFTRLDGAIPGLATIVQAVDDAPRYHLDIETDDVEAETARLVALGAVQVAQWLECRVLRAPGGHLVCVVPVHSEAEFFAAHARTWE